MTTEELSKLTDEEKRIRIATLCGWDYVEDMHGYPPGAIKGWDGPGMNELPDYLNDLNVMHDAENFLYENLGLTEWEIYSQHLVRFALDAEDRGVPATLAGVGMVANCPCPKRANALLLAYA